MTRPFVVAFNRDRDFYQVPLALEERNLLAGLVTDFYAPPLGPLGQMVPFNRVAKRRVRGLPFGKVSWSWSALRMQLLDLPKTQTADERIAIFKRLDQVLSRAVLRLALKKEAGLFLYSGYAREAFEAPAARHLPKGLFVFHPHGTLSLEILAADAEKHPEVAKSHEWHRAEIRLSDSDRLDSEWKAADFLACASSFTAQSLSRDPAGAPPITIAPYGCFPPVKQARQRRPGPARFLFVGQGVQRKGLHHLLKTWRRHGLSHGAYLSIVTSSMDPGIASLAQGDRGITVLGAQTPGRLQELFHDADVFVMPSLVEGFGLVYLEALAAGCFVIGTENTGLPDLNLPEDIGRVLRPANLESLGTALIDSAKAAASNLLDREKIQQFSRGRSWKIFREQIGTACQASALTLP